MKLTRHNGRTGKNGVYNPKHNDRQFDIDNSDHIDLERAKRNVYWDCYNGIRSASVTGKEDEIVDSFEEVEQLFYKIHYQDYVEGQNARNLKNHHPERNRTTDDIRTHKKTCPEETIYQIGTKDDYVDPNVLLTIVTEFITELCDRFGEHFHLLNWSLHLDESTPHIHERHDLKSTHPQIAKEWSEKNYPLQPDEVNAKSRKNVWWHCRKCGNEWKSVINARVKGTVCPVCAEREVLAGYNDLATTDKQLLTEWDYELNKLKPTEVSRNSAKRAWWQCRYGHSWSMKINERTVLGKGCRICEQEYLSLFPALVISYYANLKGLKVELGSDRLFGIPLDVYIPLEQVAIQVNTDSEKIDILKEHLCKQRGIKLIKLPMKPNEAESEYAQRIKAAFQSVHIFISSDTEEDVKIIRKIFKNWRNSR